MLSSVCNLWFPPRRFLPLILSTQYAGLRGLFSFLKVSTTVTPSETAIVPAPAANHQLPIAAAPIAVVNHIGNVATEIAEKPTSMTFSGKVRFCSGPGI